MADIQNLQDRIAQLSNQTPGSPEPSLPVAESEDFFRMDNPWMWIVFVAIAVGVFALWHFMGKKKSED